jgi:hypothetical protein
LINQIASSVFWHWHTHEAQLRDLWVQSWKWWFVLAAANVADKKLAFDFALVYGFDPNLNRAR